MSLQTQGDFSLTVTKVILSLPSKPLSVQNEGPTRKSAVGSASFSEMWDRDPPVSPYQR